jgi:hypothetical protein
VHAYRGRVGARQPLGLAGRDVHLARSDELAVRPRANMRPYGYSC